MQFHRTRIPLADDGAPIIRMGIPLRKRKLRLMQGVDSRLAREDSVIEIGHQLLGLVVWYFPKAHDKRPSGSQHECATQAEDSFTSFNVAQARFTGR